MVPDPADIDKQMAIVIGEFEKGTQQTLRTPTIERTYHRIKAAMVRDKLAGKTTSLMVMDFYNKLKAELVKRTLAKVKAELVKRTLAKGSSLTMRRSES